MFPSFLLREVLKSGESRSHDLSLLASQEEEANLTIVEHSQLEGLDIFRSSPTLPDSRVLGQILVFPGVVKFRPLQKSLVIPSYLSRSHVQANLDRYEQLLSVSPSNEHGTLIQPGDQIVFRESSRLVLELSDSVQVHSSLPDEDGALTARPDTTLSSSPLQHRTIEETPRAKYRHTKNTSATQEENIPPYDQFASMGDSLATLAQRSPSPEFPTPQEAKHTAMPLTETKSTSQSSGYVDFQAPDSKQSATASYVEPEENDATDAEVDVAEEKDATRELPIPENAEQLDGHAEVSVRAISAPHVMPHEDSIDDANGYIADGIAVEADDPEQADVTSTDSEQGEGKAKEPSSPREHSLSPTKPYETEYSDEKGAEAHDQRGKKRLAKESPLISESNQKRPRMALRSKTKPSVPGDNEEDEADEEDEDTIVVHPKTPSSNKKHQSPPSSSGKMSVSGDKATRVAFSNTDVVDQKEVKQAMKKMNIKEVTAEKLTRRNFDILVVGEGELKRTLKVLKALVLGKPIVKQAWLEKCIETNAVDEDYDTYTPKEIQGPCDRSGIFEGKTIFISNELRKFYQAWEEIRDICRKAGADTVLSGPAREVEQRASENVIPLVVGMADRDTAVLSGKGIFCYNKDLLSTSIIRGYVDWDSTEHEMYGVKPAAKGAKSAKRSTPSKRGRGKKRSS